ncbi:hypothetical protein Rhopal_005953-T1 [Rhodotorula paludigena]|uniref:DNA mismatch repair proteins mutS family domain-containing protein n=1 Tax=Rhodotorula paludigena TaxID=86838 RepID=A0AAV5GJU2_9BASI|nr:hypothetical protein Rhopal_005953-T1 [Rhodotorula paludigena]
MPSPLAFASSVNSDVKEKSRPRKLRWGTAEAYSAPAAPASPETSHSDDEDAEDGHDEEREHGDILAITASKGKVGCCFHEFDTGKLLFIEDQQDSTSWDLTTLIVEQLLPSTVLTASTAESTFLETLENKLASIPLPAGKSASSAASSADTDAGKVRVEYRPARDFYAGHGRLALAQLYIVENGSWTDPDPEVDDEAVDGDEEQDAYTFGRPSKRPKSSTDNLDDDRTTRNRELRIEAFLNNFAASPITLGCVGALLSHLSKVRSHAGELDGSSAEVSGLELMKLDKVMLISSDALTSLQVFEDEAHASTGSSATKEGLSLFGIVNHTRSPLGKALLRQWFIRPSLELDVIELRLDAVECFKRETNQAPVDAMRSHIKLVKNTPRLLKTLSGGNGSINDWQSLWKLTYATIMIRDAVFCLECRPNLNVLEKFLGSFDSHAFRDLGSMINNIDWEESNLKLGKVCVRSGIDASLDELRRQYNGLPSFLTEVADELAQDLPPTLAKELSVVYFPQLGYLIAIAYEPEVTDAGKYAEIGWDFQFVTEHQAYFKSDKCRDLDRHIGDLQSFVSDKEIEIAKVYEWKRPVLTEEPVCKISKGRHPLAELCVETFVPNNTSLVGGQGLVKHDSDEDKPVLGFDERSIVIVTGANFSGKSVYLKQVALITFMAHLGCFVPAEEALIGLTDRILTRISTRESITRGSSAFMIDLQQVSFALRNLTPRSLFILDEFGKGTEPNDGAGLFCGVVKHLLELGADAPRVAIATHFQRECSFASRLRCPTLTPRLATDVFLNGILARQLPVFLAHMEILIDDKGNDTASELPTPPASRSPQSDAVENVTYLYRLSPGLALLSHATSCAQLFGLAPGICARAAEVSRLVSAGSIDALALQDVDELGADERAEWEEAEEIARRLVELAVAREGADEDEQSVEAIKDKLRWVLAGASDEDVEETVA